MPPESVYRMFTPGYQNLIISPGSKVGDKPAGYFPGVRNWTSAGMTSLSDEQPRDAPKRRRASTASMTTISSRRRTP